MAFAKIHFENPHTGQLKSAPVGFSWTTLFFSFLPALLRGHWIGAVIMALVNICTLGLANLVFPFIYNKMFVKFLISEGFKATSATKDMDLLERKIGQRIPLASTFNPSA